MSIVRRAQHKEFSVIPNTTLNDRRLSWEALGMLAYLISKPTDWQVRVADLTQRPGTGRDRAYRILDELAQNGYVQRRQLQGAGGRFCGWEYLVFDEPQEAPLPENPYTAQPYTAQPYTENQEHTKERDIQKTELTKERVSLKGAQGFRPEPEARTVTESPTAPRSSEGLAEPSEEKPPKSGAVADLSVASNPEPQTEHPAPAAGKSSPAARRDGLAGLAQSLGLTGWQTNFARVAVREEKTRTAWYYLARNHPEVLRCSYRLLDKTGERGTVTWATWLPHLAEDVRTFGAGRVEAALEATIMQAMPKGCWNYYRAKVEGRSRQTERSAQEKQGYGPYSSGYTLADLEREYGITHKGVSHV